MHLTLSEHQVGNKELRTNKHTDRHTNPLKGNLVKLLNEVLRFLWSTEQTLRNFTKLFPSFLGKPKQTATEFQ